MKKLWKAILSVLLIMAILPAGVLAAEETCAEEVIYLDNGDYITVELTMAETRASNTKVARKTYTYYGSDNAEDWRAVLWGNFIYNGTTVTCNAAGCDVTITDTAWYIVSKTAGPSGSAAVGSLTMGKKLLGITVATETVNMRIDCDANGNFS